MVVSWSWKWGPKPIKPGALNKYRLPEARILFVKMENHQKVFEKQFISALELE
jgi:hypothetical protein